MPSKLPLLRFLALVSLLLQLGTLPAGADDFGGGNHVTQSADTLDQWHWAFKPYPGSNPTGNFSSFLLNSLNLGLTRNIEVGFIPLLISGSSGSNQTVRNFNFKCAIYRNDEFTYSTGYQSVMMDIRYTEQESQSRYKFALNVHSWLIAGEYQLNQDWRMIYNLALRFMTGTTQISGPNAGALNGIEMPFASETYGDHYLDFSYLKSKSNVWSLGVSRTTESVVGISIGSRPVWGAGLSHTWNLRNTWISQFNIGVHQMEEGVSKVLAGMMF